MSDPSTWSTVATVAATVVTAIATGVLAWFTFLMAKATEQSSEEFSRARVVANLEPCPRAVTLINIVVVNTGKATAFDISVEFTPPLPLLHDEGPGAQVPLRGISVLLPSQRLESLLAYYNQLAGQTYKVSVSWKDSPSSLSRSSLQYTIDMKHYDSMSPEPDPLSELADQVKKIRDDWHRVAGGSRKLKVDNFSSADRLHERRVYQRARSQQRRAQLDQSPPEDSGSQSD